jgi:hypothetical protein
VLLQGFEVLVGADTLTLLGLSLWIVFVEAQPERMRGRGGDPPCGGLRGFGGRAKPLCVVSCGGCGWVGWARRTAEESCHRRKPAFGWSVEVAGGGVRSSAVRGVAVAF